MTMKVFSPGYLLQHIAKATLQAFFSSKPTWLTALGAVDWSQDDPVLADTLRQAMATADDNVRAEMHQLLQRAFRMGNEKAVEAMRNACAEDAEVIESFGLLANDKERSLWLLMTRPKKFQDAELVLEFNGKINGHSWRPNKIPAGIDLRALRAELEQFAQQLCALYKPEGAGARASVEITDRYLDDAIQVTCYIEGPRHDSPEFGDAGFVRRPIRPALETALVYYPKTGRVETVVRGGREKHKVVLKLFTDRVMKRPVDPEEIQREPFSLHTITHGISTNHAAQAGLEFAKLRRAKYALSAMSGITFLIEASPHQQAPDAASLARDNLKIRKGFDSDFDLIWATILAFKRESDGGGHFSFDCSSAGGSTIKNLSLQNQRLANKLLVACGVVPDSA